MKIKEILLIMKLTFVIMISAFLQVSAVTYGQKITLSEKDASLEEVFKIIQAQSGYTFLYTAQMLEGAGNVNISVRNAPLESVLDKALAGRGLSYSIRRKTVVLMKKPVPPPAPVFAAADTLRGKVTDTTGSPLPGVSVIIKNTQIGTATDPEGNFVLNDVPEGAVLVFSYIGYATQEVPAGDREILDITLRTDLASLDEVVVIGYGTQKKGDLTGSVGVVDTENLEGRNISSLEEGLQGQSAGVRVVQGSGQPGGRTIVRIRGQNSILGGNDPLYVIDGVPVQSESDGNTSMLATINPSDIASINVLKDASATAIYGARGSNGVILITTRRGQQGKPKIAFKASTGFSRVIRKIDMLDSREFVEIANERAVNDGQTLTFPDVDAASAVHTDWQDEVFQTALTQDYSLSLSGGGEQTQYFVSGGYLDQEGAIIGSGYSRGSFRLNLDQKAGERLSFSTQLYASRSKASRSSPDIIFSALSMPPIAPPRTENGSYTPGEELLGYPFSDNDGDNPLIEAHERMDLLTSSRFLGNFRARYRLTDALVMEGMLGADQTESTQDRYASRLLRGVPDGTGSERRIENTYYVAEALLQFAKDFGSRHQLNATGGFTWESQTRELIEVSSSGFITDDFLNRNLGAGERYTAPSTGITEWDIVSFLGRINYNLDEKYLFTLSGRRDGSSRFGEGNKWGFFPSAAFAWRLSSEEFMKSLEKLFDLKLRFSWGRTGNQAIDPYASLQRFVPQGLIMGGSNAIGFAPDNLGNPDLKWETTDQLNAGVDLGLSDQRIQLSLDFYRKKTTDLLAVVNLPPTSGFASTLQNIGSMENRGVELNAAFDLLRGKKDWSWEISFNIAINRNKVIKLSRGADIIAPAVSFVGSVNILREGEPLSAFYGYQENGLTPDGLINYADLNGDGAVDSEDRSILGKPYPDFTYGFNSRLTFRNFDFSIFIQGEEGKELWNVNKYYNATSFYRGVNNVAEVKDRWSVDNPNINAAYPKATGSLNVQWSDRFMEDASYLRVKAIQLGYNLPLRNFPANTARIFVSGQNLFTITDYSWFNPDVNAYESGDLRIGVDNNTFPISKTITVGLDFGF